jgi:hypothetical protein
MRCRHTMGERGEAGHRLAGLRSVCCPRTPPGPSPGTVWCVVSLAGRGVAFLPGGQLASCLCRGLVASRALACMCWSMPVPAAGLANLSLAGWWAGGRHAASSASALSSLGACGLARGIHRCWPRRSHPARPRLVASIPPHRIYSPAAWIHRSGQGSYWSWWARASFARPHAQLLLARPGHGTTRRLRCRLGSSRRHRRSRFSAHHLVLGLGGLG